MYTPPIDVVRLAEAVAEASAEPVAEPATDEVPDFIGQSLVLIAISAAAVRARTNSISTSNCNRDPLEGDRPRYCQLSVSVATANDRKYSWSVYVPRLHE